MVCPTSCWWSIYNHIHLKCLPQHCVWWILRFVLNQTYLFNILLLHGQTFWWQLCIYRSINTRRRRAREKRFRGAKVFPWAVTTLVFWWTVTPIWKTRMSWFFFQLEWRTVCSILLEGMVAKLTVKIQFVTTVCIVNS